ncbi:MAG: dihydrolipoyl dehydrogenase [Pseudomonadota bacterium]|nr:dihydrolipoyl dehydrogenase [Pseudomonadota bacterium]QKK04586.1 MAG: dihydrolipoyl dehydrogenase [Pseudomonadota bacterium]
MSDKSYDVVVIGAGPGGYVCAIRAAQLGLSVACVEKQALGGTCLNVGCIPSKALLHTSERFEEAGHDFKKLGITVSAPKLDLKTMMAHKDAVVKDNTQGIGFLFKKNKVDHVKGTGKILDAGKVEVTEGKGKPTVLKTKAIVIATGSEVTPLPGIEIDEKQIVSSTGALVFDAVPKKLAVIGGGVIGLEMGTVWRRLGAEVTVIEFLDKILPPMDNEISKQMQLILKKQGMSFKLGTKVTAAKKAGKKVTLTMEPAKGGKAETADFDAVLVSIGRRPHTEGLGLKEAGVKMTERGQVDVNDHFETNVKGIYAIGDAIRGAMLAHKAEDEGMALAEILAGKTAHINYDCIPGVVYTAPEVAEVGKTEEQLKEAGIKYKSGKFPFMANGRARAMNKSEGFVKILTDAKTDKVLGCHIIGAEAGTLIAEVVLAMEFGGSAEDIARTCHAHPTLNEVVKEAAFAAFDKPIHM